MFTFLEILLSKEKEYQKLQDYIKKAEYDFVEGSLAIKVRNNIKYVNKQKKISYIPKSNIELAKSLAKKSYLIKLERLVNKRLRQFSEMLKDYSEGELDETYEKLHPNRKHLFSPIFPTKRQILEEWKSTPYVSNSFLSSAPLITTNKGDKVRSKSEKILDDKFYSLDIVYKYECPLVLDGYKKIYPDFTFISPYTCQEIYWEHFGMMDDSDYAASAIRKIAVYEKNGISIGKNLIVTFESSKITFDTSYVDSLISRYLI